MSVPFFGIWSQIAALLHKPSRLKLININGPTDLAITVLYFSFFIYIYLFFMQCISICDIRMDTKLRYSSLRVDNTLLTTSSYIDQNAPEWIGK